MFNLVESVLFTNSKKAHENNTHYDGFFGVFVFQFFEKIRITATDKIWILDHFCFDLFLFCCRHNELAQDTLKLS